VSDWFELVVLPGVDRNRPGLYEWIIEGVGSYIGKYTHFSRPYREYDRNVQKILTGRPYRPRKPEGFRRSIRSLRRPFARAARSP